MTLLRRRALAANREVVIPAVRVEDVGQHGRAQQVAHLGATHAWLDPLRHLLGHHIALHHFHPVGSDNAEHLVARNVSEVFE